ncbi:pilus assembly protein [Demequina sp. NBRC 110056]|uniref:pilus assembly protein n=1 Tax=Demequina sp. NBRC 110056 TaxID=1570345 RepID=UPI001F1F0571|nr:pilus assembly protein [Demequina sp. NBRC 110056]
MSGVRRADARVGLRDDAGGALVEFLGVTVLLLVPLVYAAIAIAQIQAATYAAEGSSAAAARGAALAIIEELDGGASDAEAVATARARAAAVVELAADDFDVAGARDVLVRCGAAGCTGEDGEVLVDVVFSVPLPGMPSFMSGVIPLEVEVSASSKADAGLLWAP